MKNAIKAFVVALTLLAFSSVSFAQATPATPAKPATPAATEKKSEKAMEKAADKSDDTKGKAKKTRTKKSANQVIPRQTPTPKGVIEALGYPFFICTIRSQAFEDIFSLSRARLSGRGRRQRQQ